MRGASLQIRTPADKAWFYLYVKGRKGLLQLRKYKTFVYVTTCTEETRSRTEIDVLSSRKMVELRKAAVRRNRTN